jgi:hypothetical protein
MANLSTVAAARVAHQAVKSFWESQGVCDIKDWEKTTQLERDRMLEMASSGLAQFSGVEYMHSAWVATMMRKEWQWGEEYEPKAKLDPRILDYDDLEEVYKAEVNLIHGVVSAVESFANPVRTFMRAVPVPDAK